ncbi:MAG: histidine kinase dimerization/phospho-acceptor domain-containing protein, partial [Dolichospermum sp.]
MSEYRVDLGSPRIGLDRIVDIFVSASSDADDAVIVMLQEKTIAEKMDRQLTHRSAARSISALGSMLAHEIKNPLSGIRGAAQLLETSAGDEDRILTQLICDET